MGKKGKATNLSSRDRTKRRIRRGLIATANRPRVSVFKSSQHTYAQVISDTDHTTIVSASTLEKEVKDLIAQVAAEQAKEAEKSKEKTGNALTSTKSRNAAFAVGMVLAKRGVEKQVKGVVFDRSGYKYAGRVEAVAEGARKGGFEF